MEKEKHKITKARSPNINEKIDLHPLRGLVTCTGCGRKLGCYASKGNGGIYHYYSCSNKYCSSRISVRKELMENQFEEIIGKMKIPKEVFNILKTYILKEQKKQNSTLINNIPQVQ